jgi:hypothetical protein
MHKNKSNSFYVYPNEIHGSLGYLSLRHKKAISFSLIPTSRGGGGGWLLEGGLLQQKKKKKKKKGLF